MANKVAKRLLSCGAVLFVVVGLIGVLTAGALISLGLWALGNGTQHDVVGLVQQDCESAGLFRPDDDGGVHALLVMAMTVRFERERGGPIKPHEKAALDRAAQWMIPREAVICTSAEGGYAAMNPARMGRVIGVVVDVVLDEFGGRYEVDGFPFAEDDEGRIIGLVDGTVIMAEHREASKVVVRRLTARSPPASELREDLMTLLNQRDMAMVDRSDKPMEGWLDIRSSNELVAEGVSHDPHACKKLQEELRGVALSCTANPDGDMFRVHARATELVAGAKGSGGQ